MGFLSGIESIGSDIGNSISGLLGGNQNNGSTTAQAAPLIQPVSQANNGASQNIANNAIGSQQNLVNALGGGIQNQNQVYNQEQGTLSTLNGLASGTGANPAQVALNNATGNNIANQAALAAGQRGGAANVGLLARENAQQGANTQQQAIGQSAALQAQQQLAAIQQQQAQEQNLASLATTQTGQQIGATGTLNNAALTNQGQLLGALQGYNAANVGSTGSENSANASIANTNANNTSDLLGTSIPAVGTAIAGPLGSLLKSTPPNLGPTGTYSAAPAAGNFKLTGAKGGEVEKDQIGNNPSAQSILAKALAQKKMPAHLKAMAAIHHPKVAKMWEGGMAEGAIVPGEPKVSGKNTEKNDVVPAMLTPKEIVLPLSVTQAKNPGDAAKAFVEEIKGKSSSHEDFKKGLKEHVKNRKSKKNEKA